MPWAWDSGDKQKRILLKNASSAVAVGSWKRNKEQGWTCWWLNIIEILSKYILVWTTTRMSYYQMNDYIKCSFYTNSSLPFAKPTLHQEGIVRKIIVKDDYCKWINLML